MERASNGSQEKAAAKKQLKHIVRRSKRAHWDKIIADASAEKNI
jgi:hypothetical protein